jgi:glycogen operon protein
MLDGRVLIHVIVNAYWEPLGFELPRAAGVHQGWRRVIDTYLESPHDICAAPDAPLVCADTYAAQPRSVVVLAAWAVSGALEDP